MPGLKGDIGIEFSPPDSNDPFSIGICFKNRNAKCEKNIHLWKIQAKYTLFKPGYSSICLLNINQALFEYQWNDVVIKNGFLFITSTQQ